ncbi:MAG: hypothetical protein LBV12_03335 [Puniceicoccales bacterium]|nr:hypothetical protein [Puniceicoccales bacterium]
MKTILLIFLLVFTLSGCKESSASGRFQSIQTQNVWTQLLLDTRTGQVWQVSHTKDEGTVKIAINAQELGSAFWSSDGRFELKPTPNMWNFILTDKKTGKMWRCQFSMSDATCRYIEPVRQKVSN